MALKVLEGKNEAAASIENYHQLQTNNYADLIRPKEFTSVLYRDVTERFVLNVWRDVLL